MNEKIVVRKKANKEIMKEVNRMIVLNLVRKNGAMSRTNISKQTGLGMSTVTNIVDELMEQSWLYETDQQISTGGRRAINVTFNQTYGYSVGVKIEEKKVIVALTDLNAELITLSEKKFERSATPEIVLELIEELINQLIEESNFLVSDLLGIGVVSSGIVNRHNGTILKSTMLGWKDVQISEMLQSRFRDTPVYADKNINALTLTEMSKGAGKKLNDFVCVSIGAGLGLSIVINNEIYYGTIGGAGEYGHTTIQVDGYSCHCGQRGCLEMYASEFYFENRGVELADTFPETLLTSYDFETVAACAKKEDPFALKLMEEMSKYLAYGLRNLINTFNPEKIILVGEGMADSELFMDTIESVTEKNFFEAVHHSTEIVKTELDNSSWVVGASLLVIEHLFQIENLE